MGKKYKNCYLFKFISFLIFFIYVKSNDDCPEDQIHITPQTCIAINDLLESDSLSLNSDFFGFLQDQNTIIKNNYELKAFKLDNSYLQSQDISKSRLYISEKCIEELENRFSFRRDKAMVIIVSDKNKVNKYNLPENYFIIRIDVGSVNYMNSQKFDFSACHEDPILLDSFANINELKYDDNDDTPINLDRIKYAKKLKIDLFDPHSEFLNNICFKFTSELGTDVTLETRYTDYYQKILFCDDKKNSHYIGFNYSSDDKMIRYLCSYGFYKNAKEKKSYMDNIDSKVNMVFSNSNFKVITCYKEILNFQNLKNNYGGAICLLVLIIQIILYFKYCIQGVKPLEEKIEDMFIKDKILHTDPNKEINKGLSERFDLKKDNEVEIYNEDNKVGQNGVKIKKKKRKKRNSVLNPPKKKKKKKNKTKKSMVSIVSSNELILKEMSDFQNERLTDLTNKKGNIDIFNMDNNKEIPNLNKEKTMKDINENQLIDNKVENNINEAKIENNKIEENKIENNEMNDIKIEDIKENEIEEKKEGNIDNQNNKNEINNKAQKEDNKDEVNSKISQIFELDNDEKNELPYEKALTKDDRNFCQYYCFMLQLSHIIINVFCRCNDYNIFSIKLGLLLITFPINLTFNAFFFTSKQIQAVTINKLDDISIDVKNLLHSFAASILSTIFLISLKLLSITHNRIRKIRKIKDINEAKKQSVSILKCLNWRINAYYILSLLFLIIFGYYCLCFCAIFENTQLLLIETMFTSWGFSLLYPFLICFVTSIFRMCSIKCKKKCCYGINYLLQKI